MKKLLALLLLSPSIYSEVLELTCDGNYPIYLKYDLENKEGKIEFLVNIDKIVLPGIAANLLKHTKIRNSLITEDFYRFDLRKTRLLVQSIYINRKNLQSLYEFGNFNFYGQCVKGKVDTPKNKI